MRKGIAILLALMAVAFAMSMRRTAVDIREGIREVEARAADGEPDAIFRLARIYERGYDSIPRDTVEALRLYRLSAENGWLPAMNYLGYMLISGHGADRNPSEGLQWIEKAAMEGDATAQSNVGFLLLKGDGVERDARKAAFWLERAAGAGVAPASSMLGDLYLNGDGVAQDSVQAEACYYAAVDGGLTDAAYKLEAMMSRAWTSMSDSVMLPKAVYFYSHGAPDVAVPILRRIARVDSLDRGITLLDSADYGRSRMAAAMAILGDAYTRARGVGYDHDKSTAYYFGAAMNGNPSAAFIISELLEIFPDALESVLTRNPSLSDCRENTCDSISVPLCPTAGSAQYWRDRAASCGVTTAEEAARRLLQGE